MSTEHLFPAIVTEFGQKVMNLTKHLSITEDFWTQEEKHLLSVVQLYVSSENDLTNFNQIVSASYELLHSSGGWLSLRSKLLSVSNSNLRDLFIKDALFQSDPDWQREEAIQNDMIINVCLQRLIFLVEIYITTQNELARNDSVFKKD
ncbi:hypothetical protein OM416_20105 [Paenibacillus sp. LS1]|uniref:hypothetical protein n=1 Tax=Paenibacillus sp. LS1 TaxID=2992120 RepID=UPI002231A202|nr:hypothetical protein [Paenibacillus sp. LS1]MCW3793900.1 hypothetical protein [Paenibacillus sp. LS1]